MRVLHVVPSYYPAKRYGGPILSVHALARALVERGHEVHVYTTNVDGPFDSDVPLNQSVDRDGVHVWYFPTQLGRRFYCSPTMGHALGASVASFDLMHLHSVFLWPTSAAAQAARRAGVPYILAPRGMLVEDVIRRKSTLAKRAWIALFEYRNINQAAAVHVTSALEAEELKKLNFRPRRIEVIPNGIDTTSVNGGLGPIDCPIIAALQQPFILFLGRVNWKKGLDRLIPAMALVPDAQLVIAGNDEEDYRPKLEALARGFSVANRVHFLGPVYGTEKWALIRAAELLVLPSYSENFGMVVLEAMACGCPVVVTPEVGLATTVRDCGAGVVIDGDPERLADAINRLLRNPHLKKQMGEAGRRVAKERFSWDVIARQMERVYIQCLKPEGMSARANHASAPHL